MKASIEINPRTNHDPQGHVEMNLPIEKMEDAAKAIRSIKAENAIDFINELKKVKGVDRAEIIFNGIAYIYIPEAPKPKAVK